MASISAKIIELPKFTEEFRAFKEEVWNRKVTTKAEKWEIMQRFHAIAQKFPGNDLGTIRSFGGDFFKNEMARLKNDVIEETYERLKNLQEQGKIRELVELAVQITDGAMMSDDETPRARFDGLEQYLSRLTETDAEGHIPGANGEILKQITAEAGRLRMEALLQRAIAMEETEEKILNGEVPGTEMLLDYNEKNALNLQDPKELIREVAASYTILTHPSTKIIHGAGEFLRTIGMCLYEQEAEMRNSDGEYVSAENEMVKIGEKSALDFKKEHPEYDQNREDRANEFDDGLKKYGFEINPNAKEGESIFSKVPEDMKRIADAESTEELDQVLRDTAEASAKAGAYKVALIEALIEMQEELHKLERMTKSSNSAEYIAMHDALERLASVNAEAKDGGRKMDELPISVIERFFREVQTKASAYENTHKGMFKGNFGVGKERIRFSRHIQTVAGEKLASLRELAQGLDQDEQLGRQLINRADAAHRAENAKIIMQKKAEVKEVNLGNLEQKLDAGVKPKIDYKALRAKLQKMQQEPQMQAPVKQGMASVR